ncbi:MAG: hypothetical protein KKH93_01530 [Candidatus Omnitrophica bacterium]|nr:hypothetical protein [Candidatus Omnitrophota bacterium]
MDTPDQHSKPDFDYEILRRNQAKKISNLSDYYKNYNLDVFMEDLLVYFDGQVDFNLAKIRQELLKPQRLENLIKKASQKNTHPVVEFLQELFQDLGQSGDVEWSGEW